MTLWHQIRCWLILKLARNMVVAINAKVVDGRIAQSKSRHGLFVDSDT